MIGFMAIPAWFYNYVPLLLGIGMTDTRRANIEAANTAAVTLGEY